MDRRVGVDQGEAAERGYVVLPRRVVADLALRYGLADGERLRIAYVPGPGDLLSTYDYWSDGVDDPSTPLATYAAQLFDLRELIGAELSVFGRWGDGIDVRRGAVRFRAETLPVTTGFAEYVKAKRSYTTRFWSEIRRAAPHVVLIGGDVYWPLVPSLRRRMRTIYSIHHALWSPRGRRGGLRGLPEADRLRRIRQGFDAAVGTSQLCADQFSSLTGGRWARAQVPQIRHGAALPPARSLTGAPAILYVGRIEQNKGVFDLVSAFRSAGFSDDARLDFYGTGRVLDHLRKMIGDDPRISAHGHVAGSEVLDLVGGATLLVCPTRTGFAEGLGFVCIEALAQATPCLLTDVVPAADLLGDSAMIIRADDTEAMARALAELHAPPRAALAAMTKAAIARRSILRDRSRSWGSMVGLAIHDVASGALPTGRQRTAVGTVEVS